MELGFNVLVKDYTGTGTTQPPKTYSKYETITNLQIEDGKNLFLIIDKDEIDKPNQSPQAQEIIHVKIRDSKTGKYSHVHLRLDVAGGRVYAELLTSKGTGTIDAPMTLRKTRRIMATLWDDKNR